MSYVFMGLVVHDVLCSYVLSKPVQGTHLHYRPGQATVHLHDAVGGSGMPGRGDRVGLPVRTADQAKGGGGACAGSTDWHSYIPVPWSVWECRLLIHKPPDMKMLFQFKWWGGVV